MAVADKGRQGIHRMAPPVKMITIGEVRYLPDYSSTVWTHLTNDWLDNTVSTANVLKDLILDLNSLLENSLLSVFSYLTRAPFLMPLYSLLEFQKNLEINVKSSHILRL